MYRVALTVTPGIIWHRVRVLFGTLHIRSQQQAIDSLPRKELKLMFDLRSSEVCQREKVSAGS